MALHSIYDPSRGFTLVEVLVVMSLLATVLTLGLFVSMDAFRQYRFHNEREIIIQTLHKARSQSMSNMCFGEGCPNGRPHGVYFGAPGRYIIFQGTDYEHRDVLIDEVIEAKDGTTSLSGFTSVVFTPHSGDALTMATDTLTVIDSAGHTSRITVEPVGRITWNP